MVQEWINVGRDLAGKRVLEIACGRGDFATWCAGLPSPPALLVAADFSGVAVRLARARREGAAAASPSSKEMRRPSASHRGRSTPSSAVKPSSTFTIRVRRSPSWRACSTRRTAVPDDAQLSGPDGRVSRLPAPHGPAVLRGRAADQQLSASPRGFGAGCGGRPANRQLRCDRTLPAVAPAARRSCVGPASRGLSTFGLHSLTVALKANGLQGGASTEDDVSLFRRRERHRRADASKDSPRASA